MPENTTQKDAGRRIRLERLLADSVGYTVSSTTGASLGRVIWLTFELESPSPAGLRVQPGDTLPLAPVGSWEIPADRVVSVAPSRREVTVALPARLPETRAA